MNLRHIRIPADRLPLHATGRRGGFAEKIAEHATREGDHLLIPAALWHEISWAYRLAGPGETVLAPEALHARDAACAGCEWTRSRHGLPHCDYPARACAKLIRTRPAETCPLGKWTTS